MEYMELAITLAFRILSTALGCRKKEANALKQAALSVTDCHLGNLFLYRNSKISSLKLVFTFLVGKCYLHTDLQSCTSKRTFLSHPQTLPQCLCILESICLYLGFAFAIRCRKCDSYRWWQLYKIKILMARHYHLLCS